MKDTGEEKETGWTLTAPPASVLPAARPPLGSKFRAAGGSTASRRCTGALGEPARTKLMGNRSVWLLPSLEQGLEGGGRRGREGGVPRDGRQHRADQTLPDNSAVGNQKNNMKEKKVMLSQTTHTPTTTCVGRGGTSHTESEPGDPDWFYDLFMVLIKYNI